MFNHLLKPEIRIQIKNHPFCFIMIFYLLFNFKGTVNVTLIGLLLDLQRFPLIIEDVESILFVFYFAKIYFL